MMNLRIDETVALTNASPNGPRYGSPSWVTLGLPVRNAPRISASRAYPRTAREYARDAEILGAFLTGKPSVTQDGEPYRGPFGDAFVKATVSSIRKFIMQLSGQRYSAAGIRRKLAVMRR